MELFPHPTTSSDESVDLPKFFTDVVDNVLNFDHAIRI